MSTETGNITGTQDMHYDLLCFTERSLDNVLRMDRYAQDAERDGDQELAAFFRRAQDASKRGGEQGKQLLKQRLMN